MPVSDDAYHEILKRLDAIEREMRIFKNQNLYNDVTTYNVALLHFNGTDGTTSFPDESGKTWTAVGNAQLDTSEKRFGTASLLLDGTGDYISSVDSIDWQLDGGSNSNSWTVDFWVYFNADPGTGTVPFINQRAGDAALWSIYLQSNLLGFFIRSGGVTIVSISNAWNPAAGQWYHVAIVKNGTNGYMMFIDGQQIGTTSADTDVIPDLAAPLFVGYYTFAAVNYYLNGRIDELRISKGIARFTGDFTPAESEY